MAADLPGRLEELRSLAEREGVDDTDWDVPDVVLAVIAYADAMGLNIALSLAPEVDLEEILEARDLGF